MESTLTNRWPEAKLADVLDRLDREGERDVGPERRIWERYSYRRPDVVMETLHADRSVAGSAQAMGRNIGRCGLSLLNGRFVYPGTGCRLHLRGAQGHERVVDGTVTRCRYVVGSGSLYEVGVQFAQNIDLATLLPHTRLVRVLIMDRDAQLPELVTTLLNGLNVRVDRLAPDADGVTEAALEHDAELLLVDLEEDAVDTLALVSSLRKQGYAGPIVGMAVQVGSALHDRCAAAGCNGYLRKPLTARTLRSLVLALVDRPLFSTHTHDPMVAPLIDEFVRRLPGRVRQLVLAFEQSDMPAMDAHARELRGQAGSYGFGPITDAAATLQASIAANAPAAHIRADLDRVVHLCRTARPATFNDYVPGM